MGWLEETHYHNVLVLRVDDVERFLQEFLERWSEDPFVPSCFSRVVPLTSAFHYESPEALDSKTQEAMRPFVAMLAGHSYHVRMHRRGFKDRVVSHAEEQALGGFVERELAAVGQRARVEFEDPDFIVVLETVGQRGGMSLWSREQRERYPFLNLD